VEETSTTVDLTDLVFNVGAPICGRFSRFLRGAGSAVAANFLYCGAENLRSVDDQGLPSSKSPATISTNAQPSKIAKAGAAGFVGCKQIVGCKQVKLGRPHFIYSPGVGSRLLNRCGWNRLATLNISP
jgi:hypothetical protein